LSKFFKVSEAKNYPAAITKQSKMFPHPLPFSVAVKPIGNFKKNVLIAATGRS
jgi:hypothetical protein